MTTYYTLVGDVLRALRRTLAPAGAALVFVAMLALAAPQAAFPHAYLVRSTPEGGERLARPPATLFLYFSEPFVESSERVSLRRIDGESIGAPAPIRRGTVVRQSLPPSLHGVIVAHWNVLSEDGHPSLGEFGFAVGDAGELPELSASASQSTPWGQSAAVWLFFVGLALALGGLVSERFIWHRDPDVAHAPVALGLLVAATGALLHLVLLAADRAGALADLRSHSDLALAFDTRAGRLTLVILGLLALAAACWRRLLPLAIVALLATTVASAARGHSGTSGHVWAVPADALHLAAAAIWVGALIHLLRVLYGTRGQERRETLGRGIGGYASLALVTVLIAVGGGILTALAQFGSLEQLLETGYGRTLVVKGALIAAALAVALAARTRALAFGWDQVPLIGRASTFALASAAVAVGLFAVIVGPDPLRIGATALFAGLLLYAALALRRGLGSRSGGRHRVALITGIVSGLVALNAGGVAATAARTTTGRGDSSDAFTSIRLLALAIAVALAIAAVVRSLPENGTLRLGRLRRLASGEAVAVVAALATASLLVNLAPPRAVVASAAAASLGPPPLEGPAIRLADFTGQIAVGLAATERQLRFDVVVPGEEGAKGLRLTAEAKPPGRLSADLYPRSCGEGCFTIRYRLPPGEMIVTADVEAPGFEGGEARFVVPWPPRRERPELLRRVARTMWTVRELEMTELVVSDSSSTRRPVGYRLSGKRLLEAAEAYRGGAVDVRVLGREGELTQLAFALPASNIWYRMWIDETYRVRREVIVNRGHRITRTFEYPGG